MENKDRSLYYEKAVIGAVHAAGNTNTVVKELDRPNGMFGNNTQPEE